MTTHTANIHELRCIRCNDTARFASDEDENASGWEQAAPPEGCPPGDYGSLCPACAADAGCDLCGATVGADMAPEGEPSCPNCGAVAWWHHVPEPSATVEAHLAGSGKVRVSGTVAVVDGSRDRWPVVESTVLSEPVGVREARMGWGKLVLWLEDGRTVSGGVVEVLG